MKPNVKPLMDHDAVDRILAADDTLIPSSGFLAATMERVSEEAAMPRPIPFPWLRALPGIMLAAAVLGWGGFELARTNLATAREISFTQLHLTAAAGRALEPAGWVAATLAVSMLSWLFARRIAGRSGLL
jgi:hypothetical protein